MKRKLLFFALAIITFAIGCTNKAPDLSQLSSNKMSAISVKGNHFVNENGDSIVFRGLCCSDPLKLYKENQWNEKYFDAMKSWGANIVRFAIHPENLNNAPSWEEAIKIFDQGVLWAEERGMYVIIDWHSIGNLKKAKFTNKMYITDIDETFRFWKTMALHYKDNNTVALYEIFNEPTIKGQELDTCTWTEWRNLQEQIIDTIRSIDPKVVCICAGFNWAYDLTEAGAEPIQRENIAYVSHPYPMKRDKAEWDTMWEKDFGFMSKNYPVICTEIGYCLENEKGAHIPVIDDGGYGPAITKFLEERGMSFTVWCFDVNWAPTLIENWDFAPTTQGKFFKEYLSK